MKKVPYGLERDFAPISMTVTVPNVLVSHPSLPAKTVTELIAFAKARPGQLQFASAGVGSMPHLMMEFFLNIPTIAEAGVPGYEAVTWFGLLAPAGTPREIVAKLHADVVQTMQDPGVRKRFIDDGAEPTPSSSPEEFAALIRAETRKWAKVIKAAGIQPE